MGVKRAVEMTMRLFDTDKKPIYIYGPLIHNPQVIEALLEKGAVIVDNEEIPQEGTLVIRAHGIMPGIQKKIEQSKINICNATCPFVIKVQEIILQYAQKGYIIIIVGDKGHAEVESYLGYSEGKGIIVDTVDKINKIPDVDKYCIVAQTTQDAEKYKNIAKRIKDKFKGKIEVHNTICSATKRRQDEAINLALKVDCIVVVGGKNSANTIRLVNICKETGTPTFFIERPSELDIKKICKYGKIGITAGASTPQSVIRKVVETIDKECNGQDPIC